MYLQLEYQACLAQHKEDLQQPEEVVQVQSLLPQSREKQGPVLHQEPTYPSPEHQGPLDHQQEVREHLTHVVPVHRQLPHCLEQQGQVL